MSEQGWRVGCVRYLNARPLVHAAPESSFEFDIPARLAERLSEGTLDAALVPIFHVLKNPGYLIVDKLCIGCRGPVYSVVIAYEGALEDILGLQLSDESVTSNALARVILTARGIAPRVISVGLNGGAQVLIGDKAIDMRLKAPQGIKFLDLGAEWLALTGLPFVFAVWAIREDVPNADILGAQLRDCGQDGLSRVPELVRTLPRENWTFARVYLSQYIRYEFGDAEKAGINEFHRRCINLGLLEETHPLRFV